MQRFLDFLQSRMGKMLVRFQSENYMAVTHILLHGWQLVEHEVDVDCLVPQINDSGIDSSMLLEFQQIVARICAPRRCAMLTSSSTALPCRSWMTKPHVQDVTFQDNVTFSH